MRDSLHLGFRQSTQILEPQRCGQVTSNNLHASIVLNGKSRAENFMSPYDFVDAPFQYPNVDRGSQSERVKDVQKRQIRQRILKLAQTRLGDGSQASTCPRRP